MSTNYQPSSPYYNTPQQTDIVEYLDIWNGYYIKTSLSDKMYIVQPKYQYRPDLLSFDTYGTVEWWWVFAIRNPDVISDPIYDLKSGIKIYLPIKDNLPKGNYS